MFTNDELAQQLSGGDLVTAGMAADEMARRAEFIDPTWIVTLYDYLWRPIAACGDDMMELSGTDPRNDLPAATLKIKGGSPLVDVIMGCTDQLVGVTVETSNLRFPFYVKNYDYEFVDDAWVCTAYLLGIYDILNYLRVWPEWYLPIQVQPISHAVYIWALCTVIEEMVAEQAFRIQSGLLEFVNNALSLNPDIRAWFGTLALNHNNLLDMLRTPVYVVRHNPFLDTSPLVARTVRMETCGEVIKDITRAYGVDVRVDLWLPGDPQPDQWTATVPLLALDQPTYVVSTKDRSQIEGPTKTVLDSVLRTVVDLGGSILGNLIPSVVHSVPGMDWAFESPLLGVDFVPPWPILIAPEPGEKGSVETCKISGHTQTGWQHIIGGRSPKWLNDLINATFAWIIDSISILIGFAGIPSNLLEGFLNDAFFAFQLIELYDRRAKAGPYHPCIETFVATSSAPYNIETLFGFINQAWETRPWVSAQATFRNGVVYTLGVDVFRGGLMSVVYHKRTKMLTDYVENIAFTITPEVRDIFVQIGDGKPEESPLAKHQRFISGLIESYNVLTLAPR